MSEKVIGYILLIVGIAVMLFSGWSVYQVLTAQAQPAQFLTQTGPVTLDLAVPMEGFGDPVKIPINVDKLVPIHRLVNTGIHVMLMGFMVTLGSKLATLGTNLVRPIVIKARESSV